MYPKGTKRLAGRITYREVLLLKEALSSARLEHCSCSPAARAEMKLYLDSWVAAPIQRVLNALEARVSPKSST